MKKKKKVRGDVPAPRFSPDRPMGRERFRAGGEAGGTGEPPPPAGREGDAAAGGGSGRVARGPAAAPSPRLCPCLPAPRSAPRREKGKAAKALRTRAGGARGAAAGGGVRGRGGGSRRGQRGAGGSAPPPPDSLPRKPEKVLHRVLCQAPRRLRAAGLWPSPSGSRRGRPGTRGTGPALPAYPRAPAGPTRPPTRPDGSWHLVLRGVCVCAEGDRAPGVVRCPSAAPQRGDT